MWTGPGMSLSAASTQPGTHRCRGDRGLAEEPLGLLELAVPAVVFAVGVPARQRKVIVGCGGAGRGRAGAGTHFWLVRYRSQPRMMFPYICVSSR